MNALLNRPLDAGIESTALDAASCYHCGLPLPASTEPQWRVAIAGVVQPMCCPGCAAVAQAIVDLGQESYYAQRARFSANAADAQTVPPQLALYDNADPRFASGSGAGADAGKREAVLAVDGITCAACVWLIERRLARLPGICGAQLNLATGRLHVRWDPALCAPAAIFAALHAIGYPAYPYDAGHHGEQLRRASKTLGRQLFVAGLSMMQVMMYVAPAYLADDGTLDDAMAALMRWASLLLTLPAICYSAQPFWRAAWNGVKARSLVMEVPVALGIAAAFGASVLATWRGHGEVYFDSVTMFIFLLLGSRYLELLARRKAAGALQRLQHALPASASRLTGWPADTVTTELVAAAALATGDMIMVRPGEAMPADCVLADGTTALDLSLLTGESAAQHKQAGDALPGGAIVSDGAAVVARVTRPARDSTLSELIKLVDRAGADKPRIALWADHVAGVFVGALLLLALASLLCWMLIDGGSLQRAWPIAIAVLVVSCPCALSLATPTALAAATDSLLRRGVLIVGAHTLETLHRASHIVFDKTGTLTVGRPRLQRIDVFARHNQAACLRLAAALEAGSAHPLARAIADAARARGIRHPAMAATALREYPGQGIEGCIDGRRYRLGGAGFVAQLGAQPGAQPDGVMPFHVPGAGVTPVYLGSEDGALACLLLQDALRPDAQATVDYFRSQGKTVLLLSGDDDALAKSVGATLGIEDARGGCLPHHKLDTVHALQRRGAVVAMVGDGINDAAVLSAADVSFAMGGGAALALAHADAVLLSGRIGSLADTARGAARTMRVIRQNLAWASAYNLVAIPAAALGYLNPWLSGAGMALSSAVVVANALRLRRT